ncbi:MgtC/SapB family protein [Embleya sp. NPDC050154]|uniref:MgtC/SapB family protein n=1 Tax=Embleya sp. NPDC050154 TaxID=3363988 RepID=UPI0037BB649F
MDSGTTLAAWSQGIAQSQGWTQFSELMLSFVLSSVIGVEREVRQKSAGLRTHALVGVGTTLFMEISKYGFADVLPAGHVGWDPSRIAAQVVSGIGFIGGGLIFVRRDTVRGLTTAAVVWLTCAIGMACGAGPALSRDRGHHAALRGRVRLSADHPQDKRAAEPGGRGPDRLPSRARCALRGPGRLYRRRVHRGGRVRAQP